MTDLIYESLAQRVEEKDIPPGRDSSEMEFWFREKWGFTIYRTAYGGESERYWQAIIDDLQAQVVVSMNERTHGKPDAQAQEILSLFRLDSRSDEQRLAGLTMQQMRETFLEASDNEPGTRPMNTCRPPMLGNHTFLLVDQDVIAAAASGRGQELWVKCVDADYRAEDAVPRNTRVRQLWFGWMMITTGSLLDFREHLQLHGELERIAPPMLDESGRHALPWDVDGAFMLSPFKFGLLGDYCSDDSPCQHCSKPQQDQPLAEDGT